MSAYRIWVIECDWCEDVYEPQPHITDLRELRRDALTEGWTRGEPNTDYCPECREQRGQR